MEESFRHANPLKEEIKSKFKKVKKINNHDTDNILLRRSLNVSKVHSRILPLSKGNNDNCYLGLDPEFRLFINLNFCFFVVAVFFFSSFVVFLI